MVSVYRLVQSCVETVFVIAIIHALAKMGLSSNNTGSFVSLNAPTVKTVTALRLKNALAIRDLHSLQMENANTTAAMVVEMEIVWPQKCAIVIEDIRWLMTFVNLCAQGLFSAFFENF